MNTVLELYPKNDQLVTLIELRDNIGNLVVGANVSVTLVDAEGSPQTGCDSLTLVDVFGRPGYYSGQVTPDFNSPNGYYTMQVSAEKDGINYYSEKTVKVQARKI